MSVKFISEISKLQKKILGDTDTPVFQPSAIELFQSMLLDCGTLPLNATSASSISVFRKHLKTHLFSHFPPESLVVPVQ